MNFALYISFEVIPFQAVISKIPAPFHPFKPLFGQVMPHFSALSLIIEIQESNHVLYAVEL